MAAPPQSSVIEVYSASSQSWFIALIAQIGPGSALKLRFVDELGRVREKSVNHSGDPSIAPFGSHLGGAAAPGFTAVPSSSRPGQYSYSNASGTERYATADLSWQAYLQKYITEAEAVGGAPQHAAGHAAIPASATASIAVAAPIVAAAPGAVISPGMPASVTMSPGGATAMAAAHHVSQPRTLTSAGAPMAAHVATAVAAGGDQYSHVQHMQAPAPAAGGAGAAMQAGAVYYTGGSSVEAAAAMMAGMAAQTAPGAGAGRYLPAQHPESPTSFSGGFGGGGLLAGYPDSPSGRAAGLAGAHGSSESKSIELQLLEYQLGGRPRDLQFAGGREVLADMPAPPVPYLVSGSSSVTSAGAAAFAAARSAGGSIGLGGGVGGAGASGAATEDTLPQSAVAPILAALMSQQQQQQQHQAAYTGIGAPAVGHGVGGYDQHSAALGLGAIPEDGFHAASDVGAAPAAPVAIPQYVAATTTATTTAVHTYTPTLPSPEGPSVAAASEAPGGVRRLDASRVVTSSART